MLDDYESFMNEYIDFMKNYNNSDNALSMLSDYSKMLSKYAEVTKSINSIDTKSLSTEDYAYYLDVTNRVLKKMTELYEWCDSVKLICRKQHIICNFFINLVFQILTVSIYFCIIYMIKCC